MCLLPSGLAVFRFLRAGLFPAVRIRAEQFLYACEGAPTRSGRPVEYFPSAVRSLEENLQRELDLPRVSSISYRAKRGRMGEVPVGSQKLRMVEGIIELRPEFRIDPLTDGRL